MYPAIRVEDLGKRYRLGLAEKVDRTFGELLTDTLSAPWRRLKGLREAGTAQGTLWALKGVSFEIQPGEVVGIIGRNAAGKSTLLKLISQITEPTTGRIELRGRVASLLEVGTGFHRELTGRENIFLSAAILGMHRSEIRQAFDAIVDFAGTERFLDTPVKRYSSGMYVRLAFSVAAHLNPEILLVDEVLAVGDAEFQRKCLGRMSDVARSGRTVLFVSHNMNAVQKLCDRAIMLEGGIKVGEGSPADLIEEYMSLLRGAASAVSLAERSDREGSGEARYTAIRLYNGSGEPVTRVPMGSELTVELDFRCSKRVLRPRFALLFVNSLGQVVFRAKTHAAMESSPDAAEGGTIRCCFPSLNAVPGLYTLTARINDSAAQRVDGVEQAASIEVVQADPYGTGRVPQERGDLAYLPAQWSVDYR